MMCRKLFFSIIAVALAATMCVGFTSCSEDDNKEEEVDYSNLIQGKWHTWYLYQNIIEFRTDYAFNYKIYNDVHYENLTESYEGNYRIIENEETEYMEVIEFYALVDSTVFYYEVIDGTYISWEIVDGTIIYLDTLYNFVPANIPVSSSMEYIYDYTNIVPIYTVFHSDARLLKMEVTEKNSNFDQLWIYYIQSDPRIIIHFYSRNELLDIKRFGKVRPGDLPDGV